MSTRQTPNDFPRNLWSVPPRACLPAVLWSWNGAMSRQRITTMLEGLAARHVGGVFIHARPGLVTDYLSHAWFDLWAFALDECGRLGLGCHIYDENSFPSGFAGGHVLSADPLAANSRLSARIFRGGKHQKSAGVMLACLARDAETDETRQLVPGSPQPATPESPLMVLELEKSAPCLWHAGFPMADVCRPGVTAEFLGVTHERYFARFGDRMGTTIGYAFTDEPETGSGARGFHLSRALLREFRADHDYPLESRFDALCSELPDSPAVRHDYHSTLNRLFTGNFARPNHDWCASHGLRFTGHLNENQWPCPQGSPSTMAFQRWMQTPGLDLLGFQFQQGTIREAALWLFNVKEATSIAAQCGRDEVLCESCGGGGYGYGPAEMKPLEDFLLALGVNRIAPHLSHQTLAGARKYDWPQTIGDHSPWWDAFASHALHIGRANSLLSAGTSASRTLVLNPTTTGWIRYRPSAYLWPDEKPDTSLDELRKTYTEFLADLYSSQLDFDLGDESVMAELGSTSGGLLRIGKCSYATVVVPEGMENMLESTARLLDGFLAGGGRVLCAGSPPSFLDGRPGSPAGLSHPNWTDARGTVPHKLREMHPPRLSSPEGSALPANLLWSHRDLPLGGSVVFLSNPSADPIRALVSVEGSSIRLCDTRSGDVEVAAADPITQGRCARAIDLAPGAHELWWVSRVPAASPASRPQWLPQTLRFEGCEALDPNVLPLDYCDYDGPGGAALHGVNTIIADTANWHAQGFDQNLWRSSIQFRRTFLDAPVAPDSAFSVRYPFHLGEAFDGSLHAAIERPWLYDVFCNDIPVPQDEAAPWFDEDMRLLPLGSAPQAGANMIELRAAKFHVLAEIMPVILRGDFRLRPDATGFVLDAPTALENGAGWTAAGRMFYPGAARYRYSFEVSAASRLRVRLPDFLGSALGVSIDGGPPSWGFFPGVEMALPGVAAAGVHRVDLILCGHLKNLLGPHFSDGLPGAWSWEQAPQTPPAGSDYRFMPTHPGGVPTLEATPC